LRAAAAIALLLASACSFGEGRVPEVDRPNIVLIIGDDHGYPDFGFMGSPYVETPQLDRLAAQGTVLTHGYNTASACRPSLRTLLTGFYPHQFNIRGRLLRSRGVGNGSSELIREFATLPRQLAKRGYASYQAGKFWEGDFVAAGFTDGMAAPGESLRHAGEGRWLGRRIPLDPVFDFIDAHADQPFFIWFALMLPHTPFDAPAKYRSRYTGRGLAESAVSYYANITRFDDLVGELISHLEQAGLRERTLVVYLADNGWDQKPQEAVPDLFGDYRGKATLYERGLRTPIVFFWPGVVPGGVMSDALVSTVDLFPTLLDYAGAPQKNDRSGRSLRPLVQEGTGWRRDRVIGSGPYHLCDAAPSAKLGGLASEIEEPAAECDRFGTEGAWELLDTRSYFLRDRDWWYVWHRRRGVDRLYDARRDPRAQRDLAPRYPKVVRRLRSQIREWDNETRLSLRVPPDDGPDHS
jgi:uncharacterized sulfatase